MINSYETQWLIHVYEFHVKWWPHDFIKSFVIAYNFTHNYGKVFMLNTISHVDAGLKIAYSCDKLCVIQ